MLPILNSRQCQLLDNRRLLMQLHGLERRTARGGRDSIDHGPGQHDDVANSVAGSLVLLAFDDRRALIRRSDILVEGAALPLPTICRVMFAVLAVDKNGMAAVIYAAKMFTGPALLILDFDVQPLSGGLLADIGVRVREFAEQCRARTYLMMIPEPMLLHARSIGLPAEAIPPHIKAEDLLLSAASFTASGEVKLCEPALAKTKTSPLGGALDFRAGADVDDLCCDIGNFARVG
jgi:hypothetical protein